jgi:hypothetical protein
MTCCEPFSPRRRGCARVDRRRAGLIRAGTGLAPTHIRAGTGLTPPTSAPGLTLAQGRALRSYIQPFVVRAIDSGLRLSPELRTYVDHVSPSARPPARRRGGAGRPPLRAARPARVGRRGRRRLRGSIGTRRSSQVHDLLLRAPRRPHGGDQRVPQSPPRRRRGTGLRRPSSSPFFSLEFSFHFAPRLAAVGPRDRWLHAAVTS